MNRDELATELGFKRSDIDMLINIFKKNAKSSLEQMHIKMNQNDMQGVADAAHAIKGSAGNLKLNEIFELSKNIEMMANATQNEACELYYMQLKEMIDLLET